MREEKALSDILTNSADAALHTLVGKCLESSSANKKEDAQRHMAWFALFGMLLYPALVVVSVFTGLDKAAGVLGDMAPTYFVSVAAIVAAFFGKEAYVKSKNTEVSVKK